jgi:acetolactate synthase I/II/III large subunit
MTRTGADLVADALRALRVRHAFGIVSIHNMPILDAINRLGYTQIIDVRHEQAGAHAADGYARATGAIGVVIASTGPGTTNTVTGLYEAAYASSRVLLITGQAETGFYGRGLGYVHEAEQQVPMLRTVARAVESPRRVGDIAPLLAHVVAEMSRGRAQPGAIEIPIDLQYADAGDDKFVEPRIEPQLPDPSTLGAAVQALKGARRRVIIAGGGVIGAGAAAELVELAERLGAPVVTTVNGRGAIPETHPLALGNLYQSRAVAAALASAEVTLAIGTRFQAGVDGTNHRLVPPGQLLHIDVDPGVIGRAHRASVAVVGDARVSLRALLDALGDVSRNDAQFNAGLIEVCEGVRASLRSRIGPDYAAIMDTMRAGLPADGIVVRDTTVPAYNFGNQLLPILSPRTSIHPTSGAIGPGLPLAIGAAIGSGRRTLVIHGDGGFMFHATELATAAQYRAPVVVCVFNDRGYGVLRGLQANRFEGRINETDLGRVDFVKLAQSMNVPARAVASVADFEAGFREALAADGPFLVDIDMLALEPMKGSILPRG